ncbi:hypothetical protein IscW_ISCW020427 [Ixodes scapularis]|uniref:Uncharacterized protein n=1 Tax=Ixodes scapularis TaxID=6945 RepID=B7PZX2_IXOSC|nr:hypothetical protein IscW_ISCW020427 [Ixodes scapularis]|eukprot:XP_002406332.1 hypothetical protein IscW_ISCW020427 [Ixodes scapularis]
MKHGIRTGKAFSEQLALRRRCNPSPDSLGRFPCAENTKAATGVHLSSLARKRRPPESRAKARTPPGR